MMRLSSGLDAVPRWARWVMFLPAGIMAASIVDAVFDAVFDALGLPRSPQNPAAVMRLALTAFAWALTLTVVPAVLSPLPWAVGVVMFVATTAAQVLGGGVALYLIRGMTAGGHDGNTTMNVNRTVGGEQT